MSKTSISRVLLTSLAVVVLWPCESPAQTVTGAISGTVVDPQGAVGNETASRRLPTRWLRSQLDRVRRTRRGRRSRTRR